MNLTDSFKLSLNSVLHRKLRAWLTLLGIIIGVAAVVSIISIGEGAQASVASRLSGFGADILTVSPGFERSMEFGGEFRESGFGGGQGRRETATSSTKTPTLTKRDAAVIQGNPNILYVNEIVSGRATLIFLAQKANVSIQGINPNVWKNFVSIELASGRYLAASDTDAIVIGDRIANSTFKQPLTLGRKVTIQDTNETRSFTVVGILKSSGTGFGGGGTDSTVYMPYTSAWSITDQNKDTFSSIQVKVRDASLAETDTNELTQALLVSRKVTGRNQDFTITSAQAIQEQISSVTQTLTLFLGAIAAVSLLVGAVGIANSMFTSVLEKTREIGILKALGSTNYEILRLFIIESGLFGLVGGIIGVIIGAIASFGISSLGLRLMGVGGEVTTLVTPSLILIAIVLSTVIGMVSGILPARSASKLKPVDALRYE